MRKATYISKLNKATNLYYDREYKKALIIFSELYMIDDLTVSQKIELIRRIADCQTRIFQNDEYIPMYDQAIALAEKNKLETLPIILAKADALSYINKYTEAIVCYRKGLLVTNDPFEVRYIESQLDEVLENYKLIRKNGTLDAWKERITKRIDDLERELDEDDYEVLMEEKPKLEA